MTADLVPDIPGNPMLKFLTKHMRMTDNLHGNAFRVHQPDPATTDLLTVDLSVTFGLIAGGVPVSMWKTRGEMPSSGTS